MSSVKFDFAVMFGFVISLVLILNTLVVITSAQHCSQLYQQNFRKCFDDFVIKYPFWDWDHYYPNSSDYQNISPTSDYQNISPTSDYQNISPTSDYQNISYYHCGYPGFGIQCAEDRRFTVMNISNQLYSAIDINYTEKYLHLKELDIDGQKCPHPIRNFSLQEFGSSLSYRSTWTLFYNCSDPPDDTYALHHLDCLDNSGLRSYAFFGGLQEIGYIWHGNCEETLVVPSRYEGTTNYTVDSKIGFDLYWSAPSADCKNCENSGGLCSYNINGVFHNCACGSDFSKEFDKTCPQEKRPPLAPLVAPSQSPSKPPSLKSYRREKGLSTEVKVLIGFCTGGGLLFLLVLIYRRILFSIYKGFASQWRNNIKGRPTNVEMFLESCGHLTVQKYKYSDIKKMTNSFKETLGQGGYGSVFKGKLKRDGRLVAVKLLNELKGNGEDFINEVATIGRTNHVNVVSLLGFCIEGTKRALVYEYMPNGSLEKFIYNEKTSSSPLGWEKLYQIALGIATGLEYLHRGCNTRILHFDIKPHNILLDEEFIPKISDFGLAKLCPTRESVVSMLVARGTIGYIAPEVYCRNFGGVSHKSDVYSYGMMVLEIIGGRKNIDATVENISEIYYPQWVYNHLNQDNNIAGPGEIFEDETTRKMLLVALWCIQTQPADRPSISKVVEMLEGNIEDLQMPPNPFQDPSSRSSP